MASPGGAVCSTTERDAKGTLHYHSARRLKRQSENCPQPEGAGMRPSHPLGKPQHKTAELGGNKQTHPSLLPLPTGPSRIKESPAHLEEMGSRAHTVREGEPDYF
ncbi:hypothetical protein ATANTOWER_026723 [Ataeniobius toweri]|uniref:Uncharacterized protein n=1 Tax=Ataeniobius toweri TaxID=208326 RepID=A0ABU7CA43_9TELE|nr:hypothetical protein [Ataeniobius toweri]